MQQQPHRTPN